MAILNWSFGTEGQQPLDVEAMVDEMTLPFGKHTGAKIKDLVETDYDYLVWLREQRRSRESTDPLDRAIVKYLDLERERRLDDLEVEDANFYESEECPF